MNQKAVVTVGVIGVFLWVFLGGFSTISWQVAGVLIAVSIGIPTLLLHYERGKSSTIINRAVSEEKQKEENRQTTPTAKSKIQNDKKEISSNELQIQKRALMLDKKEITKLDIDNDLLDQIYEQACSYALRIYYDAQLSSFVILSFPFQEVGANVTIYFDFYSKWADKICTFRYSDAFPQVEHSMPDRPAKNDYYKKVYANLPWKESPQWIHFLKRAYVKIGPLTPALKTYYHFATYAYSSPRWSVKFTDGFSGKEYKFEWDGKGLDENSIKQTF